MQPDWTTARRLLVVRLDNLGDVLLTGPAIRALADAIPIESITALCGPAGAEAAGLLPGIDDVLVHEVPWVDPWQRVPFDPERELQRIDLLRERRFDAAVIFTSYRQSSLPAAYLAYLAGIPLRLGYSFDASGSLLTTRLIPTEPPMHEVERNLALVRAVGGIGAPLELAVNIPGGARDAVGRWLQAELPVTRRRPLVVVHPGCSMPARTYPADRFAEVVALLVRDLGAQVVLTGTNAERLLIESIQECLPSRVRGSVHPRIGCHPLGELAALLETADLAITNNTGPMHLAAAVGTPSVVLFALTNRPDEWRPWNAPHRLLYEDVPCRYCFSRICPHDHHRCLNGVSPAAVVSSARELLSSAIAA